jgi:hypothetical protein
MTDIEREIMNYAYWHIWGSWDVALFLGLGVASGFGIFNLLDNNLRLSRKAWKLTLKMMVFGFVIATTLYFLCDYVRFIYIWNDVVINKNY